MSVRVHTTTASVLAVSVLDNEKINELYDFYESPLPAGQSLVLEDGFNGEAMVLMGTDDELLQLANDIRDRLGYVPDADHALEQALRQGYNPED